MVVVSKYGQMAHDMTAFGVMVWPTDTADLFMQKVMFMKVNGQKIKQMVMEYTHILMVAGTKVSGLQTNSMDLVLNNGQMGQSMMANMSKV